MMRHGSLFVLTITQRAGDGQNKVRKERRREEKKEEGAGIGGKTRGSPSELKTLSA